MFWTSIAGNLEETPAVVEEEPHAAEEESPATSSTVSVEVEPESMLQLPSNQD